MSKQSFPDSVGRLFLGELLAYRRDPLMFLEDVFARGEDVVRLRLGPMRTYVVCDPQLVHHVLVRKSAMFPKDRLQLSLMRPFLGNGLTTNEGRSWRSQRRLIQPSFSTGRINSYIPSMVDEIANVIDNWTDSSTIDIHHEMLEVTLNVVTRILLGSEPGDVASVGSDESYAAMEKYIQHSLARSVFGVPEKFLFFGRAEERVRSITDAISGLADRIIADRRRNQGHFDDLLAALVKALEEQRPGMSDQQLHDEVMTMLIAGHDTTANALAWAWHLLGTNVEWQERLHEEVATVLGERRPTVDDVPLLKTTEAILRESLRLYPSVWILAREAGEEVVLGGHKIPKGGFLLMSPYAQHRDRRSFVNPGAFDPGRFLENSANPFPSIAYIPFGAGARACIGNRLALTEMTLIMAMICQRYRLSLIRPQSISAVPLFNLHPRSGVPMQVRALSMEDSKASAGGA